MMFNNTNAYQIEPTVHHPTIDQLNKKRQDQSQQNDSQSPFQPATPKIQQSNREDSPVIKFFDSKQTVPSNGLQQQSQLKQEDNNKDNQSSQKKLVDRNISYQNRLQNSTQLLKTLNQPQQIKNQNIKNEHDGENTNSLEKDQQIQRQNYNQMRQINQINLSSSINDTNIQQQERNRSLPLQLQSYTKPSILLEKITNTFKNKSPANGSIERQLDSKGIAQNDQFNRNDKFIAGQQSSVQTRAHPQIFKQNQRIFQQNIKNNNQFPYQQNNPLQYAKIPINQSHTSQQVFTSSNTSPNSKIITKPEFNPQSSYIIRTPVPLNEYNMQTQNSFFNQSGSQTDRSFSQSKDYQKQAYINHSPIYYPQNNVKINPLNTSLQLTSTTMPVSHRNDISSSDARILNRSLNYFPTGIQENQQMIFSSQQNKQTPQAFIIQQNNLHPTIIQQNQKSQQRPNQQISNVQFAQQKQENPPQFQNYESQKKTHANLNRALNLRYSQNVQNDQGIQIVQQSQQIGNKQSIQISSLPQNNNQAAYSNTWNNSSSLIDSKQQTKSPNAIKISITSKSDTKEDEGHNQRDKQMKDQKEIELNSAVLIIQKLTNEKLQLQNQLEQIKNELLQEIQTNSNNQQQISLLQSQINSQQLEYQVLINQLRIDLENEKVVRQNETVVYSQRLYDEQQKVSSLHNKNDELQNILSQRNQNVQKSVMELEQIGRILNDNECWQKIYNHSIRNEQEQQLNNQNLLEKIKNDSTIEEEMYKLLEERAILIQEITNYNHFLKGKLQEFKKLTYGSSENSANQKELSQINMLVQQLQISEMQNKELTQEQDIMINLYECQLSQLKAQLQNKNDIIQAKYQENKFFVSQLQYLENSLKKSPQIKEDKAPIGHVAPFNYPPEKTLKQCKVHIGSFQQSGKKQEDQILNNGKEEEHLDQSEETNNIKLSAQFKAQREIQLAQFNSFNNNNNNNMQQQPEQNYDDSQINGKNQIEEYTPLTSSRCRIGENQQFLSQGITPTLEYSMRIGNDSKFEEQLEKDKTQTNQNMSISQKIQNSQLQQSEKISNSLSSKIKQNEYHPVIKREEQMQLSSQPYMDTKNLNFEQEYSQESQIHQQSIPDYVIDSNKISTYLDDQNRTNNQNNNQAIIDKYNDYLQGEKLYLDEEIITQGRKGSQNALSIIKEEVQSDNLTNVSSIQPNNESKTHNSKKNSIKNYSSYIENLKMNLKQSQEQRKQLEEQVNKIIKTSSIPLEDNESLEEAQMSDQLSQQMNLMNSKNSGISLQIEYRIPTQNAQMINEIQKNQMTNEMNSHNNSQWDSQQMPQLEDCNEYYGDNEQYVNMKINDDEYSQNPQEVQGQKMQLINSKHIYNNIEPFSHQQIGQNQNDYERQYNEILNQQNALQEQLNYLN